MCYQCGTCTVSCPSAPRSTYRIRKFMRRAVLGLENEALTDPDLWLCTTCYSCTDRCPRDIAPTDVIMAMRNLAFKRDIIPVNFLKTVTAIYASGHGVPNNDVNRAAREKLGLTRDPPTTHMYPEYLPAIRKIIDHYKTQGQCRPDHQGTGGISNVRSRRKPQIRILSRMHCPQPVSRCRDPPPSRR